MRKRKRRRIEQRENPVNRHQPTVSQPQVFADEYSPRTSTWLKYVIRAAPIAVALALFISFLLVQGAFSTAP